MLHTFITNINFVTIFTIDYTMTVIKSTTLNNNICIFLQSCDKQMSINHSILSNIEKSYGFHTVARHTYIFCVIQHYATLTCIQSHRNIRCAINIKITFYLHIKIFVQFARFYKNFVTCIFLYKKIHISTRFVRKQIIKLISICYNSFICYLTFKIWQICISIYDFSMYFIFCPFLFTGWVP